MVMAPFNTHFLVAEKTWPELDGPWQPHYGQFCFGSIAPDVDKLSPVLTQKDTHFFDRSGPWEMMASHRSAALIQQQAEFFDRPFAQLCPPAQAFALGYLCHLCVDEVSKHMWQKETWLKFKDVGPGPIFAALDEAARQQLRDYPVLAESLCAIEPLAVIPHIPLEALRTIWQGVCTFVRAEALEAAYLALVDAFERPSPELRQQRQQDFQAKIELARQQVYHLNLEILVASSLVRTRQRLAELIEGQSPEPGYPELIR